MRTIATALSIFTTLAIGCVTPDDEGVATPIPARDDLEMRIYHATIANGLSGEIAIDIPEGLQSMLIEVRGDSGLYYLTKFQTPSGDLIEGARYMTRFAREVPGLVDWLYPNTPTLSLSFGKYKLYLRGETKSGGPVVSEDLVVRVYTKKAQDFDTCGIHLDFLVDKQAIASSDFETAIDRAVVWVNNLYATVGVRVLDYQVTQITLPHTKFDVGSSDSVTKDVSDVLNQARAINTARVDSVHVTVVRSIGGSDPAGYAMGLPGPFDADRPNAAVLVSTDAYTDTSNELDVDGLASTIAHEVGHFMGLYHTSESNGLMHDPIPDTPECSGSSCPAAFDKNIMTGGGGASRVTITPGQAFVIKHHPLCQPMEFKPINQTCSLTCTAPATCSIVGGNAQCREACDPDAPACGTGTSCKPDDMGKFVCAP